MSNATDDQNALPEARVVRDDKGSSGTPPPGQKAKKRRSTGPLAWMAKNSVAANVVMAILLIGGLFKLKDIKQEVFPEFEIDMIVVNVAYPGASPEEVEQGVILAVEENIRGIDGVKDIRGTAAEGMGVVTVELMIGADTDKALSEVKTALDRITSFPEDVERPVVFMPSFRSQVVSLVLYGDEDPRVLKILAEKARDNLLQDPRLTVVEISGLPPLEISIEVPQDNLRRYGLTLDQIAAIIRQSSVEVPGGAVKTSKGEILIRTSERRDTGREFGEIVVRSMPDGSKITLRDIAEINDGFAETDQVATYRGKRAVMVNVFRVGEQTPIEVSKAVREYVAAHADELPPGVQMATWFDTSEFYKDRIDLLLKNAFWGLILVFLVLGVFLEIRLAFWVTMGIPISFIGALVFLPSMDVSINMLSLFAFILVLGMVVDDAIVVGEAVYRWRSQGMSRMRAAIRGVREVAVPVTFAIITTVVAFMPMLFVPGIMGKFFRVIPVVVISVLVMSLFESLFILPAHLAHSKRPANRGVFGFIHHQQERFSQFLERSIHRYYEPMVSAAARRHYLTMAVGMAMLFASCGLLAGGRVNSEFFPNIDSDVIMVSIEMPYGTAIERTQDVHDRVLTSVYEVLGQHGGDDIVKGIYANVGGAGLAQNDPGRPPSGGTHLAEVAIYLVGSDDRDITTSEFARLWRERVGEVPGVERMQFTFNTGPASGAPVDVELSHPDMERLRAAAGALAARISEFAGTYDVNDGFENGKEQLNLKLRPEARALGLTELDLARQIRSAFFGAEAVRQQRGRDEVKVYVRLPRSERDSEYNIEQLIIRTPQGGEVPLSQAADIVRDYSYTTIRRVNGRRAVSVTSEVDKTVNNAQKIQTDLMAKLLPELAKDHPGIRYAPGGDAMEMQETMGSLGQGLILALLAIFALLAIVFRSYTQPIIVMLAIPFGFVGALIGHMAMGFAISLMSMMGMVALAGVAVNDSLVLIDAINRLRREDKLTAREAVVRAGVIRFRPILLTSLTTFFGLSPMLLETSVQARFLIPMAISLGFGVVFATFITLLIVPAAYMVVDDMGRGVVGLSGGIKRLLGYPLPAAVDHSHGEDDEDDDDDEDGEDGGSPPQSSGSGGSGKTGSAETLIDAL